MRDAHHRPLEIEAFLRQPLAAGPKSRQIELTLEFPLPLHHALPKS